jgi:poly(3-hydroxyalkanoate) synthetase
LYDEVPVERIIEQSTKTFDFNIYSFEENACNIKLCPFVPSIMDFYMSDLITQNSKVMGECNLFLNSQSSFK